jgi:hypothetical protein
MNTPHTYEGACFCGAVKIAVNGQPTVMGYCHCDSCRLWSAGPVNAFSLWPRDAVRIVAGEELVDTYHKTPRSYRKWCRRCGGHLLTEHPDWKLTDVYVAVLTGLVFTPQVHVNYQDSVLRMHDGLPKFRDVPAEMGGSGGQLPE